MAIAMSPVKGEVLSEQGVPTLTFAQAIEQVALGRMISRLEWENTSIYGKLKDGQLMLHKADNRFYQWIISDGDIAGDDWFVLPE